MLPKCGVSVQQEKLWILSTVKQNKTKSNIKQNIIMAVF